MIRITLFFALFLGFQGQVVAQYAPHDTSWCAKVDAELTHLLNANQIEAADSLANRFEQEALRQFGAVSRERSDVLELRMHVYQYQGKKEAEQKVAQEVLDIRRQLYGNYHEKVATAIGDIARIANESVIRSAEVEGMYQEALQILDSLRLRRSMSAMGVLNYMGDYYAKAVNTTRAEACYLESMAILKANALEKSYEFGVVTNNLGNLYSNMERPWDAVAYLEISLDISRAFTGREHPDYAMGLRSVSINYRRWGKYIQAEKYALEALEIARKVYPEKHPMIALFLYALADVYSYNGNQPAMLPLVEEAFAISATHFKLPHQRMITAHTQLGVANWMNDRYEAAATQFELVRQTLQETKQTNTVNYAQICANLAYTWYKRGDKARALPFAEEALTVVGEMVPAQTPGFFRRFGLLFKIFEDQPGILRKSYQKFVAALPAIQDKYGADNLLLAEMTIVAGRGFALAEKPDSALIYLSKSQEILREQLKYNFAWLTKNQREDFRRALRFSYNWIMSMPGFLKDTRPYNGLFFETAVLHKEMIACNDALQRSVWKKLDTPEMSDKLRRYTQWRQELCALQMKPLAQQGNLSALRDSIQQSEKQLLQYTNQKESPRFEIPDWRAVQKQLQPGEAVLEFIFSPLDNDYEHQYGVLVLRPEETLPQLILLGEVAQLDQSLGKAGNQPLLYAENIYGKGKSQLYQFLWSPLEPALKGVKKVYISPIGRLFELNFRAIADPSGRLLSERYEIVCLSSIRTLVDPLFGQKSRFEGGKALLLGGVDFENMYASADIPENLPAGGALMSDRGGLRQEWNYLPETLREVQQIDSLLKRNQLQTTLLSGAKASEAALKQACIARDDIQILHIATHGFFIPKAKEDQLSSDRPGIFFNDDPMLRSGLVLAGGNPAWKGKASGADNNDGILTAEEATFFNLEKTELVVLSACETGLGEIRDYEGVYGLQRAFKIAGARNLIMTLWRVPDNTTREFMVFFYSSLMQKKSIREAHQQAVNALRKKYPAPFFWAGYVLMDGNK